MPPVAAAFAAVASGAASIGAIATVVSTVGVGLSVVGKVTGSKTLMKLGGAMGLVGGITSLATSAFGAASAAGSAGAAEGAAGWVSAEGGASYAGGMAADAAGAAASGAADWVSAEGAADYATEGLKTAVDGGDLLNPAQPSFSDARFESTNADGGLLNSSQQNASVDYSPSSQLAADQQTGAYGGSEQQTMDRRFLNSDGAYGPPADTSPSGIGEWWDKQPEKVKSAIIHGGLGAAGGLFQGWTAEQKLALERERANLISRNANAQPIVSFKKVQQPTGLLNATRSA